MKKTFNSISLLLATIVFFGSLIIISCKKNDENPTNTNTEVLIEANNNKALGKYSGILIGSSGYYTIEVRTSGSKATIIFDGTTHVLEGQGTIEEGKAITNYILQKDAVKITLSVSVDGKNPSVKIDIPGHKVYATISKETTIYQTLAFAGRIRDSVNHKNLDPAAITISNNIITGYAKVDTQYITLSGQRVDTSANLRISFSNQPGKTFNATISNNNISGGNQYIFNLSKVN